MSNTTKNPSSGDGNNKPGDKDITDMLARATELIAHTRKLGEGADWRGAGVVIAIATPSDNGTAVELLVHADGLGACACFDSAADWLVAHPEVAHRIGAHRIATNAPGVTIPGAPGGVDLSALLGLMGVRGGDDDDDAMGSGLSDLGGHVRP